MGIRHLTVINCDWCGLETPLDKTTTEKAMKRYADIGIVYKYKRISPLAEEILLANNRFVWKYLTFCCEECAKNYFEESPEQKPHYVKVV